MAYCRYCSAALCLIHLTDISPSNYPKDGDWITKMTKEDRYNHTCKGCRNPEIDNSEVNFFITSHHITLQHTTLHHI